MLSDHPGRISGGFPRCIALVVPKLLVKKTKDALEAHGGLEKSTKIRPATLDDLETYSEEPITDPRPDAFFIPTKISVRLGQVDSDASLVKGELLQSLGLVEYEKDIVIIAFKQAPDTSRTLSLERACKDGAFAPKASKGIDFSMNLLARTIGHWLHQLPPEQSNWPVAGENVLSHSWTYMIYPPLLLLPPSALANLTTIFALKSQGLPQDLSSLWQLLSQKFKTSHIALNGPIPASASSEASFRSPGRSVANILRSPTGLVPLYGDFGPALPLSHIPTVPDFSSAFWCTTRQNNIFQTWAPRYTMFSRGNVSEKARILSLQDLTEDQLGSQPEKTSAVDLYAGIGYFAFSYAKAGIGKVFCWEINPWSIEGLRRGAKKNGWDVKVIEEGQAFNEVVNEKQRLVVFSESNEIAATRIAAIRDSISPIRHVNCGLLPSSKNSWEVAVRVLDPMGGWIHVHENIAKADIKNRKEEVVELFECLVQETRGQLLEVQWEVKCEHVEQVKSYAPGIVHCVLDVSVLLME